MKKITNAIWYGKSGWIEYFGTIIQVEIVEQERILEYTLEELMKKELFRVKPQINEVGMVNKKEIFDRCQIWRNK